jgi:hypothetical protein
MGSNKMNMNMIKMNTKKKKGSLSVEANSKQSS